MAKLEDLLTKKVLNEEEEKLTTKLLACLSTRESMAEIFYGTSQDLKKVCQVLQLACQIVNLSTEKRIRKAITQKGKSVLTFDSELSKVTMIFVRSLCQELMFVYSEQLLLMLENEDPKVFNNLGEVSKKGEESAIKYL